MKRLMALVVVGAVLALGAASTFFTQNLVVQQTSNLAVATASSLGLTGSSTAPLITQCNANPPTGSTATGSICLNPATGAPFVYNGTAWAAVGGAGGMFQWSAGTSAVGALVYDGACSYTFAATASTATEPCWDLDNGTSLVWQRNSVFNASNGQVILINGAGVAANIISKTTWSNWRDRELIVDVNISGTADALGFGIFDGSASSTQTGAMVNPGSYGVELDIFNSQVQSITNGVITPGSQIPVRGGIIKNNGTGIEFDRWYLDFHDNGNSTMAVTLWRNHQNTTTNDSPYGPCDQCFGPSTALKREKWATWTVATPAFTTWKFIVAARSGGSAGQFIVNKIQSRDVPGTGAWKSVSTLPDL